MHAISKVSHVRRTWFTQRLCKELGENQTWAKWCPDRLEKWAMVEHSINLWHHSQLRISSIVSTKFLKMYCIKMGDSAPSKYCEQKDGFCLSHGNLLVTPWRSVGSLLQRTSHDEIPHHAIRPRHTLVYMPPTGPNLPCCFFLSFPITLPTASFASRSTYNSHWSFLVLPPTFLHI